MKRMIDVVCIAECDECGKFIVIDSEAVSITALEDFFMASTKCVFCEQPITGEIPKELVAEMVSAGVQVRSWETGDLL